MAYISFQPKDFFKTIKWDGDGSNPRTFTDVGFQPDMTTLKARDSAQYFYCYDSVRTPGVSNEIIWNGSEAQGGAGGTTGYMSAFEANGFTVTEGSSNDNVVNDPAIDYVAWNWKAGTTSGLSGGTLTPTGYSINTTSGIGIYKYDGSGTDGATIAHGLGATPEMIMLKCTTNTADWYMGHHRLNNGTTPWNYAMFLNTSAADASDTGFNNTAPTSSLVTLGNVSTTNNSGKSYMMYAFVGKKGYSKFGSYKGNSNADGTFIYTGFRPAWFMAMNTDAGGSDKYIFDDKRAGYNVQNNRLSANTSAAEQTDVRLDFVSNGVKIRNTGNPNNTDEWAYAAFAEFPLVSSNSKAGTAR